MQEKGLDDELSKEKLAHPYEVFNPGNFQEPLNLTKEDFWSTLKQTTPPDEEINRIQEKKNKHYLVIERLLVIKPKHKHYLVIERLLVMKLKHYHYLAIERLLVMFKSLNKTRNQHLPKQEKFFQTTLIHTR